MTTPPSGIAEADWQASPAGVRTLIFSQQQELQVLRQKNEDLRAQLTTLASELASLQERIGRSSRNSSKPPSSDGPGFKPPTHSKGSGRKRGGQAGHPGNGPELLRSNALTRWWSSTRTPVAGAAPFSRVTIWSHCGIR
jgi:hypothetical protein